MSNFKNYLGNIFSYQKLHTKANSNNVYFSKSTIENFKIEQNSYIIIKNNTNIIIATALLDDTAKINDNNIGLNSHQIKNLNAKSGSLLRISKTLHLKPYQEILLSPMDYENDINLKIIKEQLRLNNKTVCKGNIISVNLQCKELRYKVINVTPTKMGLITDKTKIIILNAEEINNKSLLVLNKLSQKCLTACADDKFCTILLERILFPIFLMVLQYIFYRIINVIC
jgi:hypothetical protein